MAAMEKALKFLGIKYTLQNGVITTYDEIKISESGIKFDSYQKSIVNKVMSQYSKEVVTDWAYKNGFSVEENKENQLEFQLVSY